MRDSKVLPLAAWYKEIDHAVHLEGQHSHGVLLPYLQVQFHHGPLQQPTATAESTTSEASGDVFAGLRRLWASLPSTENEKIEQPNDFWPTNKIVC